MGSISTQSSVDSETESAESLQLDSTGVFPGFLVTLVAVAALLVVRNTGGVSSSFVALLYLPIILSVLSCRFVFTTCTGFGLAILSPFSIHPNSPDIAGEDVMRGFVMISVALVGAVYSREMKRERNGFRKLVRTQDALLSSSQIVNAAGRLEDAVNAVLLLVHQLFVKVDCAALFFLDDNQRNLELYDSSGPRRGGLKMLKLGLAEAGMRRKSISSAPISVFGEEGPVFPALISLNPSARSALCVTLNSPDVARPPVGMLYLSSIETSAFGDAQRSLLKEFADRIAAPLHKLRVQEGLAGLAFTDGLTGLYNFRYFSEQLEEEVRRSVRYSRPLSLILFDLDDFKSVNDKHGHPEGDRLLANAAAIIRAHVRETDYPARYGGEEFAVICPETELDDATALAERIRSAFEQCHFCTGNEQRLTVTVSVGIASGPNDGSSVAELVVAADAALYLAKRGGKNQVVVSGSLAHANT